MALSIGELVGFVDLDSGPAEAAGDRIGAMFDKLGGTWGKTLGAIGAAGGTLFGASLVGAINAEPGADKLAAQLGDVDAEKWGDLAGRVYSNGFGEGLDDVNTAIASVVTSVKGMRKASDAEVQTMTEKAMTYADVMEVDVTRAAQVAGTMIHAGLAKEGGEAFDLLMKASQRVPAALREDVLDATEEYGQFFAQIGMTGPQAMRALVLGAEKGQFGIDKMGDAVKEFSLLVSTDMARTKPVVEALGLNYGHTAQAMLAGGKRAGKATQSIVNGLLKVKNPAKQARMAVELFGTPIEDLNAKDLPAFLKTLQQSGKGLRNWKGSVDEAGKTAYDNASTNLSMFGRGLKTHFVETIGGKVLPKVTELSAELHAGLKPALDVVGKVLSKVTGFLTEHKGVAAALLGTIVALTAVTMAHALVVGIATGTLKAWFMATKLVTTATKVWTAVQWALNAAVFANPLTWIVVAIVAVVVAITLIATKTTWFQTIWDKTWTAVKAVAAKVFGWLGKAVGKVVELVRKHWKKIVAILAGPLGIAVALVVKNWDKIKSVTSKGIDKVVGFVKAIPRRFKSALSSLRSTVSDLFRRAMDSARDRVVNIGGRIKDWIAGIPGKLLSLAGRFGSAGRSLLQGFIDGMKNAAGIISGIAGNVWNAVRGLLNGAISKINAALEFTINLPGKDIGINPPNIPHLATGGRVTGDTIARIGEREPETVLRDRDIVALLTKAREAGRSDTAAQGNGRSAPLIGQVVQAPGESADNLAERLWFKTRTRG